MSPASAQLSVIVPVYNGLPHLVPQIKALSSQELDVPWEIIYADNGSTDGSQRTIAAAASTSQVPIRLIDASKEKGQVYARSAGVAAAVSDCLVFTDQDDLPQSGWLHAMRASLSHSDAVGGFVQVTRAGHSPEESGIKPTADLPILVDRFRTALGTNFGIRRETLSAIGGWKDTGVGAGEDIDLCARLQAGGYSLAYAPTAVVIWRSRDSIKGVFRQAYTYGRSDVILYKRYRGSQARLRRLRGALRTWKNVLFGMVKLVVGREEVLTELHRFGWALGRTVESLRQGTLFI